MINLDGKRFSPIQNSDAGRVANDAIFTFTQTNQLFSAVYIGKGFSDGHLIGNFTSPSTAELIYHSRSENGALEAGQATAKFKRGENEKWTIAMDWQWLNGSKETGKSLYGEL